MNDILKKLKTLQQERLITRIKHLRGKHDQLDHAWNRGMGQGGYGAGLAENQMGPLPTADFYRKRLTDLTEQRRRGEITRAEMRQQMRDLRGITLDALESNQDNDLVLANRRGSRKPLPGQLAFDFDNPPPAITPSVPSTPSPTPIPLRQRTVEKIKNEIKQMISPEVKKSSELYYSYKRRKLKYYHDYIVLSATKGHDSPEAKSAKLEHQNALANQRTFDQSRENAGFDQDFLKVLDALKHEDPQTVTLNFPKSWKKDEIDRVKKIIEPVIALAPMQTSRQPIVINVRRTAGKNAAYYPLKDEMRLGAADAYVIIHETVHAMQFQLGWGMRASNDFGKQRTSGENLVPLKPYGYGEGKTYIDSTDDPYTFKVYGDVMKKLNYEVLSTAMESLLHMDAVEDQELMDLLIQVIKDGGV